MKKSHHDRKGICDATGVAGGYMECVNHNDDLLEVGIFTNEFNKILGTDIKSLEIFRSKGLPAHMVKKKAL